MSYKTALDNLLALEYFGMKLGLRNIEALLEFLGRPDRKLKTIHVAGTNGKGSVCATLAAYYQTKGLTTGLYTSPHLVDYRERIRINGEMIDEAYIEWFVERTWPKVQELNATFFEVTTALAFDFFASQDVDIAIIETGLGGKLDATNVLEKPLATVITSIGMDHMQHLGNSILEIAREKAGIFKQGVPAIVNVDRQVFDVFRTRCEALGITCIDASTFSLPGWTDRIRPQLQGEHQKQNLRTALVTLAALGELDESIATQAVANVASLAGLRARLESGQVHWKGKTIHRLLDVAHNEAAMLWIAEFLKSTGTRVILVAGFMSDKDVGAALKLLSSHVLHFYAVQPMGRRALASAELAAIGETVGLKATDGGAVIEGYRKALDSAQDGDTILVTGSHYLVGELLANEKRVDGVI